METREERKNGGRAATAALIGLIVLVMAGVFALLYFTALKPLMQKRTPAQETVQTELTPQLPETNNTPAADPKPEEHPAQELQPVEPEEQTPDEGAPQPERSYAHAEETETTQTLDLQLYSEGALLIDADTNTVIAEKNPDGRIFPASMTKVMTALVACEQIENWDDTFTMTQEIIDPLYLADASLAGFVNGEEVLSQIQMRV